MKTVLGLVLGIAMGLVLFYLAVIAAVYLTGCLKDCSFPIWPMFFLVCAPLVLFVLADLRRFGRGQGMAGILSGSWIRRRSIPIGMALSSLHLNRTVSDLFFKALQIGA